jgi:hypothetical protein
MLDRSQASRKDSLSNPANAGRPVRPAPEALELRVRQPIQQRLGARRGESGIAKEGVADAPPQAPARVAGNGFQGRRGGPRLESRLDERPAPWRNDSRGRLRPPGGRGRAGGREALRGRRSARGRSAPRRPSPEVAGGARCRRPAGPRRARGSPRRGARGRARRASRRARARRAGACSGAGRARGARRGNVEPRGPGGSR